MCDYSLHNVMTRPAKIGDKLVTTTFCGTLTRGFAAIENPQVAVCLRPGTELAFEQEIESDGPFLFFWRWKSGAKVARFRQINSKQPNTHHDAVEFPSGKVVLLTRLSEGQLATVLQLPAADERVDQAGQRSDVDAAIVSRPLQPSD